MWHQILKHFQTLEQRPAERMIILVGSMMIFWIIEGAFPLLKMRYKKTRLRHASVNLLFTLFFVLIHFVLAIFIVRLSDWCRDNHFGLVYWIGAGTLWTIILCVMAQDFANWLAHLILHKIDWLWPLHIIHHSDNNVDVTTGLRHHPGDSFFRGVFFILFIGLSGSPMYTVMIYQTLAAISTAFTHANIRLPRKLDYLLSFIIVSPNMHKVHHHWKQPYTDSNYGNVFSVWDRLLGTFKRLDPSQIRYGLDRHYPNERDEDIGSLMKRPFQQNQR
jgi:sterol desaturase/sphingolipid hydroxylase (fatty acid hydroxylase superfamily)